MIDQQSSDFVVVKRPDESSDTICKASNIADVVLIGFDTIKVTFKSAPQNFGEPVVINKKPEGFQLVIDTNGTDKMIAAKFSRGFEDRIKYKK